MTASCFYERKQLAVCIYAIAKEDTMQDIRKLIVVIIVLSFAVLFTVGVSVAWFAFNEKSESSGLALSHSDPNPFDLATKGETSYYATLESELGFSAGAHYSVGDDHYYKTEDNITAISLQGVTAEGFGTIGDRGINPGTAGTFTLYTIPRTPRPGTATIRLSLTVNGYQRADDDLLHPATTESDRLLGGHILFFTGFDGINYSGWIDGSFTVEVPTDQIGTISIYWIWPAYFDNYVSTATGYGSPLCTVSADPTSDYQRLLADTLEHPEHYFKTNNPLPDLWEDGQLTAVGYKTRFNAYNSADEHLGTNVGFALCTIRLQ